MLYPAPPMLSVVVPVSNEEKILERKTEELVEYLENTSPSFEIVFVENGSTDNTPRLLRLLAAANANVSIVTNPKRDYSSSIVRGIMSAHGDVIITAGIDFTDLAVIKRCLNTLKDSDLVICSKNIGFDGRPFNRRLANHVYNSLVRVIFGIKFSDVEGYHGMRRTRVQSLVAQIDTRAHLFNLWLLLIARRHGLTVREVPLYVTELRTSRFSQGPKLAWFAFISVIEFARLKGKRF